MANLSEAFEEHLRSLNDDEWNALASRVRTPTPPPAQPLPGEGRDGPQTAAGPATKYALDEARRRGWIDADGSPVK